MYDELIAEGIKIDNLEVNQWVSYATRVIKDVERSSKTAADKLVLALLFTKEYTGSFRATKVKKLLESRVTKT